MTLNLVGQDEVVAKCEWTSGQPEKLEFKDKAGALVATASLKAILNASPSKHKRRSLMPVTTTSFGDTARQVDKSSRREFDLNTLKVKESSPDVKATDYDLINPGEAANKFYDKNIIQALDKFTA